MSLWLIDDKVDDLFGVDIEDVDLRKVICELDRGQDIKGNGTIVPYLQLTITLEDDPRDGGGMFEVMFRAYSKNVFVSYSDNRGSNEPVGFSGMDAEDCYEDYIHAVRRISKDDFDGETMFMLALEKGDYCEDAKDEYDLRQLYYTRVEKYVTRLQKLWNKKEV